MVHRICFEGNIGAGKTSLARMVQSRDPSRFAFYPEPVQEWKSTGNVLQAFYAGVPGSGFLAQTLISQTILARDVPQPQAPEFGLYERSLFSAKMVFIPAMLDSQRLTKDEAAVLVGRGGGGGQNLSLDDDAFFRIMDFASTLGSGSIWYRSRLSM